MIIYGTRGINTTKGQGKFYCPQCTKSKRYRQINVRRFFTLYFIPIIPLDLAGSYVECMGCKGTFDPKILSFDPEKEKQKLAKFNAQYMEAIKNVMLLIMMADGVIDDDEVTQIQNIYRELTGKELTVDEVNIQGREIINQGTLDMYLKKVTPKLNLDGRFLILKAAMEIAAADGEFQEEEQVMIDQLIKILELPKKRAKAVVKEYFS